VTAGPTPEICCGEYKKNNSASYREIVGSTHLDVLLDTKPRSARTVVVVNREYFVNLTEYRGILVAGVGCHNASLIHCKALRNISLIVSLYEFGFVMYFPAILP
jgi:hypothetical protein